MDNRQLIKELLNLSDEALNKIDRPGMTGEHRKVAEHYANGGEVEFLCPFGDGWRDIDPDFNAAGAEYRMLIKRKMILVGDAGVPVPAPEVEVPGLGGEYFVPDGTQESHVYRYTWGGDDHDFRCLRRGLVYLDKNAAQQRERSRLAYRHVDEKVD